MKHLYPDLTKGIVLLIAIIIYKVAAVFGRDLPPIALPANFLNFTALLVNDKVSLAWSTSQGSNVSHYNIERSYDNKSFKQAALIFTAENPAAVNNYSYNDPVKNVPSSVIYYRLKMIDKDGKYKYSEVRTIAMSDVPVGTYYIKVMNRKEISTPTIFKSKN